MSARRVHEWAWGDRGRRTVCGNGHRIERIEVVDDLGRVALERRCRNCNGLRAAYGESSRAVLGDPALTATGAAGAVVSALERRIMSHATGWESKWPLYRNHFCTSEGGDDWAPIQRLVEIGLMRVSREPSPLSGGDTVFCVTAIGIATLKGGRAQSGETDKGSE
jgi:hypothetical protein